MRQLLFILLLTILMPFTWQKAYSAFQQNNIFYYRSQSNVGIIEQSERDIVDVIFEWTFNLNQNNMVFSNEFPFGTLSARLLLPLSGYIATDYNTGQSFILNPTFSVSIIKNNGTEANFVNITAPMMVIGGAYYGNVAYYGKIYSWSESGYYVRIQLASARIPFVNFILGNFTYHEFLPQALSMNVIVFRYKEDKPTPKRENSSIQEEQQTRQQDNRSSGNSYSETKTARQIFIDEFPSDAPRSSEPTVRFANVQINKTCFGPGERYKLTFTTTINQGPVAEYQVSLWAVENDNGVRKFYGMERMTMVTHDWTGNFWGCVPQMSGVSSVEQSSGEVATRPGRNPLSSSNETMSITMKLILYRLAMDRDENKKTIEDTYTLSIMVSGQ